MDEFEEELSRRYAGYGFYSDDKDLGAEALKPKPQNQTDSFFDVLGAGFRQGAGLLGVPVLYNLDKNLPIPDYQLNPINAKFNPIDYVPDDLKERYAEEYFWANTPTQVQAVTNRIRKKQDDDAVTNRAGLFGEVVKLGSQLFDPINLMPVGGIIKTAKGVSLLKSGLVGAALNAGSMGAMEVMREANGLKGQYGDSALNIGGAALLGGLLGTGGAALAKKFGKPVELLGAQLEKELVVPATVKPSQFDVLTTAKKAQTEAEVFGELIKPEKRSGLNINAFEPDPTIDLMEPHAIDVPEYLMDADKANPMGGSAVFEHMTTVIKNTLGPDRIKDENIINKLVLIKDQDPVLRTILSPSTRVRDAVQQLVETPLKYVKNYRGEATTLAVESVARQSKALLGQAVEQIDNIYANYRKTAHALNPAQWREEIAKAMRRGDKHPIAEVANAAKALRATMFEPLLKRAEAIGALPEGMQVGTAESYLTRLYDREKIVANRPAFEQINYEWLQTKNQLLEGSRRTEAQLRQAAQQIVDRIVANRDTRLPYDLMDGLTGDAADLLDARAAMAGIEVEARGSSGSFTKSAKPKAMSTGTGAPFKRRLYDIPDEMVEDFLVNDALAIAKNYERTMSVDLALMESFKTPDLNSALEKMLQEVADDYAELRKAASGPKELQKLGKMQTRDMADIRAMWQRLRGVYGLPADMGEAAIEKVGKVLRAANYVSLMGNVVLSSLSDAARPMMVHGLKRYLTDGLLPLVKEFKAVKASARETQLAGTAWDLVLDTRMASLSDFVDEFGGNSRFDRAMGAAQSLMGKASGIAHWNQSMKQWAGVMTQTRILEVASDLASGKKVHGDELAFLAANNIDRPMAERIFQQYSAHGEQHGTVRIANTGLWDDAEAVTYFRAGLGKEVDKIIVTPGADKPLLLSKTWGKLALQFQSFFFASTQRVMLSGLQDRNLGTLAGITYGAGLGVVSVLLTHLTKFNDPNRKPLDMRPDALILEGLDRSGAVSWLFNVNNSIESLTRGHYGLSAAMGKEPMTRYQDRNITDAIGGASLGRVEDFEKIAKALSSGDYKRADVRAARRLLPFQNLFYTRWLFDEGEKGLDHWLGVQEN
jgi:hypothetical protein